MKNMKEKNNKKMNSFVCGIFAAVMITVLAFSACKHPADNSTDDTSGSVHTHIWGGWTVTKDATCTEKGEETKICTLDATHKETREIAIDPNAHDWQQLSGTAPTCTTDGNGTRKCNICNKEESDNLPAHGHNFVNRTLTTAPTCSAKGIETAACSYNSSHTDTRDIPIDPDAHNWANNWKITTPPTVVQGGIETDTCAHNTSHTRTRSITIAVFTDITDFETYLSGLDGNTAAAVYTIKLNVNNLGGDVNTSGSVGNTLSGYSAKYISLDLSDSAITGIEDYAFRSCENLTNVNIPDGVTGIGDYSFDNCSSLTRIIIPNSVKSIGNFAFNGCTSLASVTLPVNADFTSIGNSVFNRCTSLTDVNIPNSVTSIGIQAFESCAKITSITIPSSVTGIGGSAFNRCTGITSVIIPGSVKSIGDWSFGNNPNLTSVTFQGTIPAADFNSMGSFLGDLRDVFYATNSTNGTPGTYTTTAPVSASSVWTKK